MSMEIPPQYAKQRALLSEGMKVRSLPEVLGEGVKYRPLNDKVFIKKIDSETVSPGGLLIAGTPSLPVQWVWGTVVAMGPGRPIEGSKKLVPMSVKVGDEVLFDSFKATDANIGGEHLFVIADEELYARRERGFAND